MSMKAYQERLIALVKDTVTLLCKNGLEYSQEFCVEGLLGVTLDKSEVFLIPIKELVNDKGVGTTDEGVDGHEADEGRMSPKRERKKKRRHVESTEVTQVESPIQYESRTEWEVDTKEQLHHDNNQSATDHDTEDRTRYLETDSTEPDLHPPSSKQRRREENRTDLSRVKAEDIVVIKEEVDDEEFASAFQDSSMDSINMSRTEQGDSSMAFFPQPGTSQGGMNFSMEQLAGGSGLAGAMQGMPPGSEAGDGSWLQQNPGDMPPGDWQNQKHQVFPCPVPNKKFHQRHYFESRLKLHRDQNLYRYSCEYCGKRFNSTGNLRGHLALHTGHKEFHCTDCDKEFAYKTHLKVHRRRYHGDDGTPVRRETNALRNVEDLVVQDQNGDG